MKERREAKVCLRRRQHSRASSALEWEVQRPKRPGLTPDTCRRDPGLGRLLGLLPARWSKGVASEQGCPIYL